jgi:hypothetical protein
MLDGTLDEYKFIIKVVMCILNYYKKRKYYFIIIIFLAKTFSNVSISNKKTPLFK